MRPAWIRRSLVTLCLAPLFGQACAKATDEDLVLRDHGKGGSAGTSTSGGTSSGQGGTGAQPFGGAAGFGAIGGTGTSGTAGTAGTAGKGGTGATAGDTGEGGEPAGGAGGTDSCTLPGTPPALRVDYKRGTASVTDDPAGDFHLVNDTGTAIPLRELSIRYWLHSEFSCTATAAQMAVNVTYFQLQEPYVAKSPSDVRTAVVSLDTGDPGCDVYFQLGFATTAGSLAAGQMATLGVFTQIPIYNTTRHDQTNDYSYGACQTAYVYWSKLTLYRNGSLVSGREPGGGGGAGGEGGAPGGGQGGAP